MLGSVTSTPDSDRSRPTVLPAARTDLEVAVDRLDHATLGIRLRGPEVLPVAPVASIGYVVRDRAA